MLSQAPGIPGRKTVYPSAAAPFTPDVSASFNGVTDDDRASIIFVQLPTLYISFSVCQHKYFKKYIFVVFYELQPNFIRYFLDKYIKSLETERRLALIRRKNHIAAVDHDILSVFQINVC